MGLRKLLREPLLHFLLIGLLLFWIFNMISGARGGADRRIVINDATVESIVERYGSLWQRPPTSTELQGLLDNYVREEVLYREGATMGLERDDPVVRRRVLQKLDVITEERSAQSAPSDADLEAYLKAHAERYARPADIGFDQVMLDPVRHGARLDAHLAAAHARLVAGADPAGVGDNSLLPTHVASTSSERLARDFGDEFVAALVKLPQGTWEGPVRSGYGMHWVRVNSTTPGRAGSLAEVRDAVTRDWENDRRLQSSAEYYRSLRKDYRVVVEAKLPAGITLRAVP